MTRYRPRRSFAFGAALALLAACQMTGGLAPVHEGLKPPPGTPVVHEAVDGLIVGHRLMAAGEYELALKAYLRAAGEDGINADVLSALGSANLKLGRLGQAEQLLRRALEKDPTFVPALNNLGVVLMNEGKYGEARLTFRKAFALDSGQSDEIRENLRLALAKTENTAYDPGKENTNYSPREAGRRAVPPSRNPVSAEQQKDAKCAISSSYPCASAPWCCCRVARIRATRDVEKAVKDVNAVDESNLNDIMLTVADPNEAVAYFRKGVTKKPDDIAMQRGLANSLVRADQPDEGAKVWARVAAMPGGTNDDKVAEADALIRASNWKEAETVLNSVPPTHETFDRYRLRGDGRRQQQGNGRRPTVSTRPPPG